MENFYLESTPKTPRLSFNNDNGIFEISGRSIPENSIEFYKPLLDWMDQYVKQATIDTTLIVKLEYFNTSSSKCLVEIFRKLEKLSKVKIEWYYDEEDEDMQESGEDFKEIIKIPIEMKLMKDSD